MTLHEFRTNKGLVERVKEWAATPDWRFLREALTTGHPMNDACPDQSPGALARQLGRIEGYNQCLRSLELAAIYYETPRPIPETFEPPKPRKA